MSVITFTKVKLPNGWLGNMAPYPIEYGGLIYRTSEALFQAVRFAPGPIREAIRAERSPMAAKMVAKRHANEMLVPPRSVLDIALMRNVLAEKLTQHADELVPLLLATGDAEIIEDVSGRPCTESNLFWGKALNSKGLWLGTGMLGKIWMELRGIIRQ